MYVVLTTYASSEGSDETAHLHSLVRAVAAHTTGAWNFGPYITHRKLIMLLHSSIFNIVLVFF